MIQAIRETNFRAYIETKANRIGNQTGAKTRHLVKFINDLDEAVFYAYPLDAIINNAIFAEDYDEMVTIKDIDFFSLCEHHLLPFFGRAHVAYIPNGKIIGLSKVPRIVDMFSRRLQVQERMTENIAKTLNDMLKPKGVAVVIEGEHMCMQMRGVEKQNSYATTSSMKGIFLKDSRTREEFLTIISMKK